MSYDIRIVNKTTRNTICLKHETPASGSTTCLSGNEAWLNITYNYNPIFVKLFGEEGIRSIYGKDIAETLPLLDDAVKSLNVDVSDNYWACTEGNVRKSIKDLIAIAEAAITDYPETPMVWSGD